MRKLITIVAFFDRAFNLFYNRHLCISLVVNIYDLEYGNMIKGTDGNVFRYLGRGWFKLIQTD
jgi:hypothetical protein